MANKTKQEVTVEAHTRGGTRVNPFRRRQRKTRNRSKARVAAKVLGGAALLGGGYLGARKGLQIGTRKFDTLIENRAREMTRRATKGATAGAVQGAGQGVADGVSRMGESVKQATVNKARSIADIPKNTAEAFNIGRNVTPANEKDVFVNLGTRIAKVTKRGKSDIKKTRTALGFTSLVKDSVEFSFEPSDADKYPRLFEFAKRRTRRASRPLTPQHREAISRGLQEYYDTIPKKEETKLDKAEKVTKSISRLAGAARTTAEAANLFTGIYERLKKPTTRQNIREGVGIISSLSGSARNLGGASRGFAGAANIVHDLATGAKGTRQKFREDSLEVKRQANKTNRQVHAVRANLERQKARQKDQELNIRRWTAGSYERISKTAASSNMRGGTKYEDMRTRRAKLDDKQLKRLPFQ